MATLTKNNFKSVSIKSVSPTMTTVSISGQRQSKGVGTQYWQISAEYPALTRNDFNSVMGFINKQRGSLYQFEVIIPDLSNPAGDIRKASGASSASYSSLYALPVGYSLVTLTYGVSASAITNGGGSSSLAHRAGDFIRFAGHSKVYQIVEDTSYGSDIKFYPNLIYPVAAGEAVTLFNVPFTVYNTNDSQEYKYGTGLNNSIILELQEAL